MNWTNTHSTLRLCLIGLALGLTTASVSLAQPFGVYVQLSDNQRIYYPKEEVLPEGWQELVARFEIEKIKPAFPFLEEENLSQVHRLTIADSADMLPLSEALQQLSNVVYAEPVPTIQLSYRPNDPDYQRFQWYLQKINAEQAWNQSRGSDSVVVAIVDDAVSITHSDLSNSLWQNPGEIPGNNLDDDGNGLIDDITGWDVADDDQDVLPPANRVSNTVFSHGTHCTGIAAATSELFFTLYE